MNSVSEVGKFYYDIGFQDGYLACKNDFAERARMRREQKMKQREKTLYFLKQKAIGILMIFLSILSGWLFEGDITVAILMFPLGIALLISKSSLLYLKGGIIQDD